MPTLRATLFAPLLLASALVGSLHAAETIDINSATASELATAIHGVGQKKAEAIIAYRDAHGPFATIDDLVAVSGISINLVEKNREQMVAVQPAPAVPVDGAQ